MVNQRKLRKGEAKTSGVLAEEEEKRREVRRYG
jgi:hypothetical protein